MHYIINFQDLHFDIIVVLITISKPFRYLTIPTIIT